MGEEIAMAWVLHKTTRVYASLSSNSAMESI